MAERPTFGELVDAHRDAFYSYGRIDELTDYELAEHGKMLTWSGEQYEKERAAAIEIHQILLRAIQNAGISLNRVAV